LNNQQSLRPGPELIQAVIIALGGGENVDNHVPIIEKDPAALVNSFAAAGAYLLFVEFFFNITGDGFYLPFAVTATNYKIIGYDRNFANVQQDDIFGLFVIRYIYNGTSQVNRFDKKYSFEIKF
jgi:hypothetical protein